MRVTRLFKLFKQLKGLQQILFIVMQSLPAILNVFSLLQLELFIMSILGVYLMQGIE